MRLRCFLAVALSFGMGVSGSLVAAPNFLLILIDDLGYGDLGCYGSERHQTPHIDRLAAEGVRFTDFHSNGPMCTPTRAALLTGQYQQRLGRIFESAIGGREHYDRGLPAEPVTLGEALQSRGYATACFGKWHLGYQPPHLPTRHGFSEFKGLGSGDGDHHSHIDRSGRPDWWHGEERVEERGYTADLLTDHAVDFITRHREESFFVYLPHLAIHFPWQGPEDPPHREAGRDYWNDKWGIIPDRSNVRPHVKSMVESVDRNVGRLMDCLRRFQLDTNTVVVFASDNGGYTHYGTTHQNISSNGPLRGQKTELFEGGHRVPGIIWWPGRIAPRVADEPVMTFDLYPTFLAFAGEPSVSKRALDGVDLSGFLLKGSGMPERTLYWRMDDEGAVRQGPWKWIQIQDREPLLFHLGKDLGEQHNLAQAKPERAAALARLYRAWELEVDQP